VSPESTRPGELVAIRFPDHQTRGVAYTLDTWEDHAWTTRFYLTSDAGDLNWTPDWWAVENSEGRGVPDIGITGPGPDHVRIPDTAPAGNYRLCTANTPDKACASLTVTT
jgi:hypothetical protein